MSSKFVGTEGYWYSGGELFSKKEKVGMVSGKIDFFLRFVIIREKISKVNSLKELMARIVRVSNTLNVNRWTLIKWWSRWIIIMLML